MLDRFQISQNFSDRKLRGRCLLFSILLTTLLAIPLMAQDEMHPIKGCGGRIQGSCRAHECVCTEWWVDYYSREGRVWGAESAKTLDALQRKIERSQKFDHTWARFIGEPVENDRFNHQQPGRPTCVIECTYSRARSAEEGEARDRIQEEADGIFDKIIEEWNRVSKALVKAGRRQAAGNRFAAVGLVLKDYANALKDVIEKQKELRGRLHESMTTFEVTMAQLQELIEDLRQAQSAASTIYEGLPENARDFLANREPPIGSGNWMSQRINDSNGQTVLQDIRIANEVVTITYRPDSEGSKASKTYTFSPRDLSPDGVTVQRTESGQWVMIVSTTGRRITQVDSGLMGSGGSEIRSRVILYFNSEDEAREAANALGTAR